MYGAFGHAKPVMFHINAHIDNIMIRDIHKTYTYVNSTIHSVIKAVYNLLLRGPY